VGCRTSTNKTIKKAIMNYKIKIKTNTELTPSLAEAYIYRGIVLSEMLRWEEAVQDLNKAIELDPLNEQAYLVRAEIIDVIDDEAPLKDYNKCIEMNPNKVELYAARGLYFYTHNKDKEALKDFAKVLKMNPNDIDILQCRGDYYTDEGMYPEAFLDYHKVLEIKPNDACAHRCIAEVLFHMGYYEAGMKSLKTAAKLNYRFEKELDDPCWKKLCGIKD